MLRDLDSYTTVDQCIAVILSQSTTDITGTSVDMAGYGGVRFIAMVGASLDTLSGSVKIELEMEHSDDNSSWEDCANTDLSASVTGTNPGTWAVIDDGAEDEQRYKVHYRGTKRYVRPMVNKTGTHTNGIPVGVIAERFDQRLRP